MLAWWWFVIRCAVAGALDERDERREAEHDDD